MAAIQLKDVVKIIRSGEWFSCCVISCDLALKKAGKVLTYEKARIARKQTMEAAGTAVKSYSGITRPANHNANFTLNIELPSGMIRTIHPALVYKINNQPVI